MAEPDLVRRVAASPELKLAADPGTLTAYLSAWGRDLDGDVIRRGAWAASIAELAAAGRALPMLLHHDPARPVGTWSNLVEDARGLRAEGRLVLDTADGAEAYALAKAGALAVSVGFRVEAAEPASPPARRTITRAKLLEASLVAVPANEAAAIVSVKGVALADPATVTDRRAFESWLRSAGWPRSAAKALAARGWAGLSDDAGPDKLAAVAASITQHAAELRRLTKKG